MLRTVQVIASLLALACLGAMAYFQYLTSIEAADTSERVGALVLMVDAIEDAQLEAAGAGDDEAVTAAPILPPSADSLDLEPVLFVLRDILSEQRATRCAVEDLGQIFSVDC